MVLNHIFVAQQRICIVTKDFYIVNKEVIILMALMCVKKLSFVSKKRPKCSWILFILLSIVTYWDRLIIIIFAWKFNFLFVDFHLSESNMILHWYIHEDILIRSSVRAAKNIQVSSVFCKKNLPFKVKKEKSQERKSKKKNQGKSPRYFSF